MAELRDLTVAEESTLRRTINDWASSTRGDGRPRLQVCRVTGALIVDPDTHASFIESLRDLVGADRG